MNKRGRAYNNHHTKFLKCRFQIVEDKGRSTTIEDKYKTFYRRFKKFDEESD